MQSEGISAIASLAAAAIVPLARLVMRLALRRRSRKRRKKQIEHLKATLRAEEACAGSCAWHTAAWRVACEVSVGVVDGIVASRVESHVERALRASGVESTRVSVAVARSVACYVEALREATSSKRRLFAAMQATIALYRLALFHELCSASYGTVVYCGEHLVTGRVVTARAVRVFYETASALGVPCVVYVLMHREGGLVVLSVMPERAPDAALRDAALRGVTLGGAFPPSCSSVVSGSSSPMSPMSARSPRGAMSARSCAEHAVLVGDRAALTTMRGWVTNECVGEHATVHIDGAPSTLFAVYADEEQLVVVDAEARLFVPLHALFLAEHAVAARVERGVVVAAVHTARAAHVQGAVGLALADALPNGKWQGESCVSRSFDVAPDARLVLVTLCRAAWV
jgi:hypothetical protein